MALSSVSMVLSRRAFSRYLSNGDLTEVNAHFHGAFSFIMGFHHAWSPMVLFLRRTRAFMRLYGILPHGAFLGFHYAFMIQCRKRGMRFHGAVLFRRFLFMVVLSGY